MDGAPQLQERKLRARADSPNPVAKKVEPPAVDGDTTKGGDTIGFFEGFAGSVNGRFFKAPLWVDLTRPPGTTSQEPSLRGKPEIRRYLSGAFVFFSPALVWLSIALIYYLTFPYDLTPGKTWTLSWVGLRFLANSIVVFGFVGFWHVSLYCWGWGKRPFNPQRKYRLSKVFHNMFYNVFGVFQWTLWEALFVHCYSTGRLPYISDEEAFGSAWGFGSFVASWFWVTLWREFHFYFAHRFLHFKFLYKYAHSLHHRNSDIEPFAGLSMHPVEHMFYFACAGPLLYVKTSPFAVMWMGIHLLISPAASHSGFEDNMQSDQFHYLHHRFFECNYGTGAVPYDVWFGTFRESLEVKSKTYRGEHVESKDVKLDAASAALADSKATLLGFPKWDEATYNLLTYVALPLLVARQPSLFKDARLLGALMAVGPLVVGCVLLAMTSPRPLANPRLTFLYPFHKERWVGAFGITVAISLVVTVLPVYHLVQMAIGEPGTGAYYALGL